MINKGDNYYICAAIFKDEEFEDIEENHYKY